MVYWIIPIDDPGFDDARWQEYYELLLALQRKYNSTCRSASWNDLKQRSLSLQAEVPDFYLAVILEDDVIVGWIDFMARNTGTDEQMVYSSFNILPKKIPNKMVRTITAWTQSNLLRYEADVMFQMATDERYATIAERWGGKQFSRSQEYVLHRDKAKRSDMEAWIRDVSGTNQDLVMRFYVNLPDDLFDDYIELLEQAVEDIPEEEESGMSIKIDAEEVRLHNQWRQNNGIILHQAVVFNHDNQMVALTEASSNTKMPKMMDQMMTAVCRDYRGRGLAKWLKAAMFFELERQLPQFEKIATWMRTINEPMQHINAQMGFVPERLAREFKIPREGLRAYLDLQDDT